MRWHGLAMAACFIGNSGGELRAESYSLTRLGEGLGLRGATAVALNNRAEAVGYFFEADGSGPYACVFRLQAVDDLFTAPDARGKAYCINDIGTIIGYYEDESGGYQFARIGETIVRLQAPSGYFMPSWVNGSNMIVGTSNQILTAWESGRFRELGILGQDALSIGSAPRNNDFGTVAGTWFPWYGFYGRAFICDQNGLRDLGTLGGSYARAYDINNNGLIVGETASAPPPFDNQQACVWIDEVAYGLGTLGGTDSIARAVNDLDEIVGLSLTSRGFWHVFKYVNGDMQDVSLGLPTPNFYAQNVFDSNNAGQILMQGALGSDRVLDFFILTPRTCNGFVRGDMNSDARIDFDDIAAFVVALGDLRDWQEQYPSGNYLCQLDANHNGRFDFDDIAAFVGLLAES